MKHDALCKTGTDDPYCALCHCELIAAVRQDERAKFEHWTNKAISEKREAEVRVDERALAISQIERLLANENFWEHDEIRPGLVAALAVIKGEWKFNLGGEQE